MSNEILILELYPIIPMEFNFTAGGSLILKCFIKTNVFWPVNCQTSGQLQGCHTFLIFSMKQIISLSTAQMPPSLSMLFSLC